MFQGEVDGRGNEGWGNDETNDLRVKPGFEVGVGVQQDAADVSDGFGEAAQGEGDHVGPCLVTDAEN